PRGLQDEARAPDPRRAAVRGTRRRGGRGGGDRRARDGCRVRARPTPGGRRRRGAQLAGGEVVDKGAAVALTAVVGGMIALQAPINSMLGKRVGTLPAASVSFFIGTALLVALTLMVGGGFGRLGEARHLQWYYLM